MYVAGGIGSGINMENAVNIGMFPDVPLDKFHYIGNSSLSGAYVMLLSTKAEKKTYELASNMTYMELSTVPTYMDEFVGSCFIPVSYTHLCSYHTVGCKTREDRDERRFRDSRIRI